jgi:hypothetical protein
VAFSFFTIYFDIDSVYPSPGGWPTSESTCGELGTALTVYVSGPSPVTDVYSAFTNGKKLYLNSSLTTLLDGADVWYKVEGAINTGQVFNVGTGAGAGDIISFATPSCVTTTSTTTLAPTTTTTTSTTSSGSTTTTTSTTTVTPSSTTTTTTTTTSCFCYLYDVFVDQLDLDDATGNTEPGKDNNTLYLDYDSCSGVATTKQYTIAGTYFNDFCASILLNAPTIYYYKNNAIQTLPAYSSVSNTSINCCP